MDEIQKILVKAGRKDLAQKYYKKVAISAKDYIYLDEYSDARDGYDEITKLLKGYFYINDEGNAFIISKKPLSKAEEERLMQENEAS